MTQNELQKQYELRVKVAKVLSYHKGNMWGIISCNPLKIKTEGFQPELSIWGNFVIKGNMIPLQEGNEYDIVIGDKVVDKRWGDYYPILEVKTEKLDTVESQQKFLESITTEIQYKSIIETYPDCMIIDLISEDKVDLTKVKGIGKFTADKIKKKIEENRDIGVLIAELADINITGNSIKKIVNHFGSATFALYKIRESIYNLCEISGFGFKTVDKHALKRGEEPTGDNRIRAYCYYYFDIIGQQGHSWINEKVFLKDATEELGINGKYIRDYLNSEDGQNIFYWDKNEYKISTKKMYNNEKETLENLIRIKENYTPPEIENIDEGIKIAENSLGIKYTDEQKNAILEALNHGVFILNGRGGTGKSAVIRGIVEVLESCGLQCHSIALSGKASNVLANNGLSASTIHRALGLGVSNDSDDEPEILNTDVLIVDEGSMVNAGLFKLVVKAVKDGGKIIIVGDSGQLSGIGHGDVLRDLLATNLFAKVELKQIHRQAQDSGIIEVAGKVREGKQIVGYNSTGKEVFGNKKDMIVFGFDDREDVLTVLKGVLSAEAKKVKKPEDLLNLQIVTANKDRGHLSAKSINILAQEYFNDLEKPYITRNGYDFREGDKVIVKGNTYNISYFLSGENYEKFVEFQENINLGLAVDYEDLMSQLFELRLEIEYAEKEFYSDYEVSNYGEEMLVEEEMKNNQYISELYEKREQIEKELEKYPKPLVGDLFNGTMGIIKKIDLQNKCIHVEFENLGYVIMIQEDIDSLELAYAVTCHRLQGSTIKNVVVALDFTSYGLLSRQWVYTAITRASSKCVMLVETNALHKAISVDASGNRRTFLGDMIQAVE